MIKTSKVQEEIERIQEFLLNRGNKEDNIPQTGGFSVSFDNFNSKKNESLIYDGTEAIPFEKRHPQFKTILRKEFSKALKDISIEQE